MLARALTIAHVQVEQSGVWGDAALFVFMLLACAGFVCSCALHAGQGDHLTWRKWRGFELYFFTTQSPAGDPPFVLYLQVGRRHARHA